jgi:hypothetical protein
MKEPETLVQAQAKAKARAEEREQTRREAAVAALNAERGMMRRSWLEAGGDEEAFEKSWPAMRDTLLADRARSEQDLAQSQTDAFYSENF